MSDPTPTQMLTEGQPQTWLPTLHGDLIIQPLRQASIALLATGRLVIASERTHSYAVPTVEADPTVAWLTEGQEIGESNADLGEASDIYHKVGGLTIISRELAQDSDPSVIEQVGIGLANSIAQKIDHAFFGARDASTLPPKGLGDLSSIVTTPGTYDDLSAFTEALVNAAAAGSDINAWVCNAATATRLFDIRQGEGSAVPLLQPDPTQEATGIIAGRKLFVSEAVADDTVFGIPADGAAQIIMRADVTIEVDGSVYFTSDRIAIKATARLTNLFPHEAAIQKITLADDDGTPLD